MRIPLICMVLAIIPLASNAWAGALDGEKRIKLVEFSGAEHVVGSVVFEPSGDASKYEVRWLDEMFEEHFLSMRPFKCFEGTTKYWCRVPYPYEIKKLVSESDLTDLEYDLMFIWKGSTEYGINMWNGVYYQLEIDENRIIGKLNEIDMDKLSAPPEKGNLRPVNEYDLEPGEPENHWLPTLIIRMSNGANKCAFRISSCQRPA